MQDRQQDTEEAETATRIQQQIVRGPVTQRPHNSVISNVCTSQQHQICVPGPQYKFRCRTG